MATGKALCSSSSEESSAYTTSTEEREEREERTKMPPLPIHQLKQPQAANNQQQQQQREDPKGKGKGKGKPSCNLYVSDSASDSRDPHEASSQLLVTSETPHASTSPTKYFTGRIFSEDDEIVILKGMAEYQACNNGLIQVLSKSISNLHACLSKSLGTQVSVQSLYKKIGRLKQRYKERRCKKTAGGGGGNFTNDHDRVVYNLSEKVWGDFVVDSSKKRMQPISDKKPTEKRQKLEKNEENYPFLCGAANRWMKNLGAAGEGAAADLLDVGRAKTLEKKLKGVKILEMHYHAEEMALRHECWLFMVEAMT